MPIWKCYIIQVRKSHSKLKESEILFDKFLPDSVSYHRFLFSRNSRGEILVKIRTFAVEEGTMKLCNSPQRARWLSHDMLFCLFPKKASGGFLAESKVRLTNYIQLLLFCLSVGCFNRLTFWMDLKTIFLILFPTKSY